MRRGPFWIFVALLIALSPSVARAQKEGAAASARVHFAEGVKLYDATPPDYSGALAEFEEAYRAKPSAGIKRNVALCLKALHQYPQAIDALEQMLQEGGNALTPDVREAANKAIADLYARIATVLVRIVPHVTNGQVPHVTLSVDEVLVPPETYAKPLRLLPGKHVFKVRAAGYFEAAQTTTLAAGDKDVPVVVEMVAIEIIEKGRLTVHANVSTAAISIDGITVGTETWTGDLRAGMHRIDVAAQGYPPYAVQVEVPPNESRALAVDMNSTPTNRVPAYQLSPAPAKKPERKWFLAAGLVIQTESLRFGQGLDEPPAGTRRSLAGGTVLAQVGRRMTPYVDVLILGELGALSSSSYAPSGATPPTKVTVTNWALAPELRVHTRGALRGLAGVAIGVEDQSVSADVGYADATGTGTKNVRGGATAGMLLVEIGGQIDLGRVFVEATGFVDMHGVGGAEDNLQGKRLFLDSPAARAGARLLVGYTF